MKYKSWKDRWTAMCWKICFPGEAIPVDILPSYYAQLKGEEPKKISSKEEALTAAICLDMEMYPSDWEYKKYNRENTKGRLFNSKTEIEVTFNNEYGNHNTKINGIPISIEQHKRIVSTYDSRTAAQALEKVLDRIQKVTTVSTEDVIEEVRPKVVDPFSVEPQKVLQDHLEGLKRAANFGKALPPPAKKLNPPQPRKIGNSLTKPKQPMKSPDVTWKGKKLSSKEFKKAMMQDSYGSVYDYMLEDN